MTDKFDPVSCLIGAKLAGGGGGVTVEPLTVTENGTKTAPAGKAYSPVTVAVESDVPFPIIEENSTPAFYDAEEVDAIKDSLYVAHIESPDMLTSVDKIYMAIVNGNYVPIGYVTFYSLLKMIHADLDADATQDFYYILLAMDVIAKISPSALYEAMSGNVTDSISNIASLIPHDNQSSTFATQIATVFFWLFVLWVYGETDLGLNDSGVQDLRYSYDFTSQGVLVFSEMASTLSSDVDMTKLQAVLDTVITAKDVKAFLCYLNLIKYNAYTCWNNYMEFNNTDLTDAVYSVLN